MHVAILAALAIAVHIYADTGSISVCDKYSVTFFGDNNSTQQEYVSSLLIITTLVCIFTGLGTSRTDLPGSSIAFSGALETGQQDGETVNLLPYFDGSLATTNPGNKAVAVNFLDSGGTDYLRASQGKSGSLDSNQHMLLNHLIEYFAVLLGCSSYGQPPPLPAYAGVNSQYEVHKFMNISQAEWTWFVDNIRFAAQSLGFSKDDVDTIAVNVSSDFGFRCAQPISIVPNTPATLQQICIGDGCPRSDNPVAGCNGTAATGPTPSHSTMSSGQSGTNAKTSGLSTGAKAGLAIGVILAVLLLAAVAYSLFRRRKSCSREPQAQSSHDVEEVRHRHGHSRGEMEGDNAPESGGHEIYELSGDVQRADLEHTGMLHASTTDGQESSSRPEDSSERP